MQTQYILIEFRVGRLLLAWLAVALAACGTTTEPAVEPHAGAGAEASEVASVSQALGGWTELWAGESGQTSLHLGAVHTVFKRTVDGCDVVDVVETSDGSEVMVEALPECVRVTAAGGPWGLILGASNQQLYRLEDGPAPPIGGAGGAGGTAGSGGSGGLGGSGGGSEPLAWIPIAATPGSGVSRIFSDASYVYWQDSFGVHRVPAWSGTVQTLATNRSLLGIEGSNLYLQSSGSGSYSLRRMPVSGGSQTVLYTHSRSFRPGFGFDSNHFYFTEDGESGGTNRLRSLTKSGSKLSTVKSSTVERYRYPRSTGSALYWREEVISTGAATIRRKNLSNGNHVTASFPMLDLDELRVMGDGVYATGKVEDSPAVYALERTPL